MKVFITGGTGFLGTALVSRLAGQGHRVTVLTRSGRIGAARPGVSYIQGDPAGGGEWQKAVAGHDAVVNLAGATIFKRWTASHRQSMRDSRILTTRNLVAGLAAAESAGVTLLSGSAIGYYGFREEEILDEQSPAGTDFLAGLARDWEAAALEAEALGVRVVISRTGIILGQGGGALAKMLLPFRLGLGSPLGSGNQWFSWIAMQDMVNGLLFLLERRDLRGPFNFTAPHPVTNREMTESLAGALGRSVRLPAVPALLLKLAMGELGTVLLQGQRVVPLRLQQSGFNFACPTIREAWAHLLAGRGGKSG